MGIEVDDAVFQLFVGGLIALFPLVLRYLFLRVRLIRHRTGELFVPAVKDVARTADVELFFDVRRRLYHPLAAPVLAAFPDAVVVLARGADVEPGREVFPAFDADDAVDVLIRFCPVAARDLVRCHHDALQIVLRQPFDAGSLFDGVLILVPYLIDDLVPVVIARFQRPCVASRAARPRYNIV